MTKTTKGVLWLAGPFIVLFLVLVLWAISSSVFGLMGGGVGAARTVNMVLGFLGILSIFAIPVGLIIGIVVLVKKDQSTPTVPSIPSEPPV